MEACWNSGLIHDELEEIEQVEGVELADPHKTRLIRIAQIKTDRLDAHALGTLLRGNLVARAHVPSRQTGARRRRTLSILNRSKAWPTKSVRSGRLLAHD